MDETDKGGALDSQLYPEHELALSLVELDTAFASIQPPLVLHSSGTWSRIAFNQRSLCMPLPVIPK